MEDQNSCGPKLPPATDVVRAGRLIDKVLLREGKPLPQSKLFMASDLFFKYGCKRISRLMPGFAKVVKKRISGDVDLLGNWKVTGSGSLTRAEWTSLAKGKGGLVLIQVVKELVGQAMPSGPLGELARGLLDSVALLLTSPGNFSGVGVAKLLESLKKAARKFGEQVLLKPLAGKQPAAAIAKALLDAGLDLLGKARSGGQLLRNAKALLGSLVRALLGGVTKKLGAFGKILTTAMNETLSRSF